MEAKTWTRPPAIWLLVLISFSGTLAMHMFIPVLPEVARDLNTSIAGAQMTLSLYIFGLAVGQLFYGPLSDRIGRRPTLIIGLTVYAVAGAAAALAPSINTLLGARLAQALGGCAGLVLGRAMVRDTAPADQAMRRLAFVTLALTIGPGLAPIIGGLLSLHFGWRSIFWILALFGVLNLVLTLTMLPETATARAQDFRALVRDYNDLLTSRAFVGLAIGGACSTTSLYAFIAAAPFIYVTDFHRSTNEAGLYVGLVLLGTALGSILAGKLAGNVSMERMITCANLTSFGAAAALLATVLTGNATTLSTAVLSTLYAIGPGLISPAALTKAVSVNPRIIGSSAGLYGCCQMTVGAICTALTGVGSDPMLAAAVILTVTSIIGQIAFFLVLKRGAT